MIEYTLTLTSSFVQCDMLPLKFLIHVLLARRKSCMLIRSKGVMGRLIDERDSMHGPG